MSKTLDKYGRYENRAGFRNGDLDPYIVEEDSSTGITYICYGAGTNRAIRRITEVSVGDVTTTTIEIAYGAWANRASLTYQPINQDLSV